MGEWRQLGLTSALHFHSIALTIEAWTRKSGLLLEILIKLFILSCPAN